MFICSLLHSLLYIERECAYQSHEQFQLISSREMTGLYAKKALNLAGNQVQLTGLIAIAAMVLMFLSSLRPVRNYAYRFFLFSHIIGWMAVAAGT